jgi:KRAB domain-containing zinc finger protein
MLVQRGEKPFPCQICDKKFSQHSTLRNLISTHTKEKPFSYQFCHGTFSQSGKLRKHQLTPIQEKGLLSASNANADFQVKLYYWVIPKSFSESKNTSTLTVTRHVGIKAVWLPIYGVTKWECSLANSAANHLRQRAISTDTSGLTRTKGLSPAHKMSVDGKSFRSNEALVSHRKTPETGTEEKTTNYFCVFCGKASGSQAEFTRHMRTHTKEKLCKCNICNKGFGCLIHVKICQSWKERKGQIF